MSKKVLVSIKDILCPKCRRIIYAGESWCTYCGEFINPELTYVYSEYSNTESEEHEDYKTRENKKILDP